MVLMLCKLHWRAQPRSQRTHYNLRHRHTKCHVSLTSTVALKSALISLLVSYMENFLSKIDTCLSPCTMTRNFRKMCLNIQLYHHFCLAWSSTLNLTTEQGSEDDCGCGIVPPSICPYFSCGIFDNLHTDSLKTVLPVSNLFTPNLHFLVFLFCVKR